MEVRWATEHFDYTCTPQTERYYQRVGDRLKRTASAALGIGERPYPEAVNDVVKWLSGEHGRFAASTIRHYRAVLYWQLDKAVEAGRLSQAENDELRGLVLECKPKKSLPKAKGTSGRKRKAVSLEEIRVVVRKLNTSKCSIAQAAGLFLYVNCFAGLRPSEWRTARIQDRCVIVSNGKFSNGRANGKDRTIVFEGWSKEKMKIVDAVVTAFRKPKSDADFARWYDCLRARIAWVCKKQGIKRICPYSTRHIAIATQKKHTDKAEEIAAFAGHASTKTATQHYARAHTGWRLKSLFVRPATENVASIEPKIRSFDLEQLQKSTPAYSLGP